jgi:Histidine kinase.
MNRIYSIAYLENAEKTQEFLEKIICFFRYYTAEEEKLVRLKEELSYVKLFIDILSICTGKAIDFVIQSESFETADIYVPSRVFLLLTRDFLISDSIKSGSVTFKAYESEEGTFLILRTELGELSSPATSSVKEVQRIFQKVCNVKIDMWVEEQVNGAWEMVFLLPVREK